MKQEGSYTLIQIHPDQLTALIDKAVQKAFERKAHEQQPYSDFPDFMTRKQTAKLLNISIGTVDNWTVQGKIKQYIFENVKRYKKHEIIDFLKAY